MTQLKYEGGKKTGGEDILRFCWDFTAGDALRAQRLVEEV